MLNDRKPPTTSPIHAWASKILYSVLPLNAGFLDGPDALGANVVAAPRANFDTSVFKSLFCGRPGADVEGSEVTSGSLAALKAGLHARCGRASLLPYSP